MDGEKSVKKVKYVKTSRQATAIISIAACFVLLLCVFLSENRAGKPQIKIAEELVSLENADLAQRDALIRVQREKRLEQMRREELAQHINEIDDSEIWSLFEDYVILGDSRAVGFSYYHYLRYERVLASGGDNIRRSLEHLDELKALSPSTVYLCYGLNDTGVGYWKNGDEYAQELRKVLPQLRKALPDAVIVASSILPATESAIERSPAWGRIPDFDSALKKVCEETGVIYCDNSEIVEKYMSTKWNDDGVHLDRSFYPMWAKNLYAAGVMGNRE